MPTSVSPSRTGKSSCEPERSSSIAAARVSRGVSGRKFVIMASRTGMPRIAARVATACASCCAPRKTKNATITRSGLMNSPMIPKPTAMTWPTVAAIRVART